MPVIIFLIRMKFHLLDLLDIFLVLIFFNLVLVTLYQHLLLTLNIFLVDAGSEQTETEILKKPL